MNKHLKNNLTGAGSILEIYPAPLPRKFSVTKMDLVTVKSSWESVGMYLATSMHSYGYSNGPEQLKLPFPKQ